MTDLKIATTNSIEVERLAKDVLDCCFAVHKEMGAGLLEKVYKACLINELQERHISFEIEKSYPLFYKGKKLNLNHQLDLVIDNKIVIELKADSRDIELHKAQLISYLKISGIRLGFLVNFNSTLFKDGIKRIVI